MPPQKDTRPLVERTDVVFYDLPAPPNDYLSKVESVDDFGVRAAFLRTGDDYVPIVPPGVVGDVYLYGINNYGMIWES